MDKRNKNIIERFLEFFSQLIYAFSFYVQELKEKFFGGEKKSNKVEKSIKKPERKEYSHSPSTKKKMKSTNIPDSPKLNQRSKSDQTKTVRQVDIEDILEAIQEEQRQQEKIKNISNIYEVNSQSKPKSHITEISLEEIRKRRESAQEQKREESPKFEDKVKREQKKTESVHKTEVSKAKPEIEKKAEKKEIPNKQTGKKEKSETSWLKNQLKSLEELKKKREEVAKKDSSVKEAKKEKTIENVQKLEEKERSESEKTKENLSKALEKEMLIKQEKANQDEKLEELKKKQEEQLELIRRRQQEEQKAQFEELRRKQQEQNRLQAEERKKKEQEQLAEKLKRQQRLEELQRKEQEEIESLKKEKEQAELELRRIRQQEKEQLEALKRKQQEKEQLERLRLEQEEKKHQETLRLEQEEKDRQQALRLAQEEKKREEELRLLREEKEQQEKLRLIQEAKKQQEQKAYIEEKLESSQCTDIEEGDIEEQITELLEDEQVNIDDQIPKKRDFRWIWNGTVAAIFVIILMLGGNFIGNKISANINTEITMEAVSEEDENSSVAQEEGSVTLTFVGDLICHMPQFRDAYDVKTGQYNFSKCFSQVDQYLQESDLTIGNLETVFAGKDQNYSGYPTFNTPDDLARTLKEVGFDVLTTANNHSFDRGENGVVRTLDVLDDVGINHMGTYRTAQEKQNIVIKEVNGIKFAFVSFTAFTNQGADNAAAHINYLTQEEVNSQIQFAKAQNPDCIVAMPHWGEEYETVPNDAQKEAADMLIKAGADIIIGSHPHVVQKMGKKKVTGEDGNTREVFVAYSLGNFTSNQNSEYTRDEVILNLTVKKGANGIYIEKIGYRPVYMNKQGTGINTKSFQLIDIITYKKEFIQDGDEEAQNLYNTVQGSEEHIKMLLRGEAPEDENAKEIESSATGMETTTTQAGSSANSTQTTQTTREASTAMGNNQTTTSSSSTTIN